MFPDLGRAKLEAVYRGFKGNFETTFEMVTLAMADGRKGGVRHGRRPGGKGSGGGKGGSGGQ